jgi:ADP-ribosyl-[dinitrogen reductase] hydrolase
MIGAIIGDIVGSPYEGGYKRSVTTKEFPLFSPESRFTDDTVLTCATAQALLSPSFRPFKLRFAWQYQKWALRYPDRGYGSKFKEWIKNPNLPVNNSYANGCMMRCSPIAMYYEDRETALKRSAQSIAYTHNSPESLRGVQSIVDAIWMARHGATKDEIKARVQEHYGHMLNLTLDELKAKWSRDIRSNLTAQQALICFMESNNYESAVRNAVYINGDTDTNAAIAGAIAEQFYGRETIPLFMITEMRNRLTEEMIEVIGTFYEKCGHDKFGL